MTGLNEAQYLQWQCKHRILWCYTNIPLHSLDYVMAHMKRIERNIFLVSFSWKEKNASDDSVCTLLCYIFRMVFLFAYCLEWKILSKNAWKFADTQRTHTQRKCIDIYIFCCWSQSIDDGIWWVLFLKWFANVRTAIVSCKETGCMTMTLLTNLSFSWFIVVMVALVWCHFSFVSFVYWFVFVSWYCSYVWRLLQRKVQINEH